MEDLRDGGERWRGRQWDGILLPKTGFASWGVLSQKTQLSQELGVLFGTIRGNMEDISQNSVFPNNKIGEVLS